MTGQPPPLGEPHHRINLPFEANPPGQTMPLDDMAIAGGLVVAGAVVPFNGYHYAGLIFRFIDPTGQFLRPILLLADDDQILDAGVLVRKAVRATLDAAERAR